MIMAYLIEAGAEVNPHRTDPVSDFDTGVCRLDYMDLRLSNDPDKIPCWQELVDVLIKNEKIDFNPLTSRSDFLECVHYLHSVSGQRSDL